MGDAKNVLIGVPGACVFLLSLIRWTKVLSSFTARRFIAARRSTSDKDDKSLWRSHIRSALSSSSQQWYRAVAHIATGMAIPVLYMVHSRENKDHRSGELPLLIEGGFIFIAGVVV